MLYREYATITDVRTNYLSSTGTGNDTLILDFIRDVSQQIDATCVRSFTPLRQTRKFDFYRDTKHQTLFPDRDLCEILTLTNGDNTAISAAEYVTEPRNDTPIWGVKLLWSSGKYWTYTTDSENAISLDGVWAYHTDYVGAWQSNGATLAANAAANAASITCTTGKIVAGNIIKIDDEFMYVSSVTANTSDTVAVVRGVNGSTANTHASSTSITIWRCEPSVKSLTMRAAAALMRLRDNPLGDTISMDGVTFQTPKDVAAFIASSCKSLALIRGVA